MLNRTSVDDHAPLLETGIWRYIDNASPEALLVASNIPSSALTLPPDVHLIHNSLLIVSSRPPIRRNGWLLPRKEEFVNNVRMLAVCMRHVPEHTKHPPNAAGTEDLDAGRERVGWVWCYPWHLGFRDTEDRTEKGESAHCVVS